MEFTLTEGQNNVRQMMHFFGEAQIRPVALKADREHCFPDSFNKMVHQMGFSSGSSAITGSGSKPKKGDENTPLGELNRDKSGQKQNNRFAILASEELGWACPAAMLSFPGPGLAGPPVGIMGTEEQKKLFFGTFEGAEPAWGAYALTEPGCGSDAAAIQTTATKDGDHYIINGQKSWITNGGKATWNVVFATIDKNGGKAAHRAFLVKKGTPGFSMIRAEEKLGLRASQTAQLAFDNVRVPAEWMLGGEDYYEKKVRGGGFKGAMKTFDATRPMVASIANGIARAAWEKTRDVLNDGLAAGPLLRQLRAELAAMKSEIEMGRLLAWKAAWMADVEIPNTREASVSKGYSGSMVQRVTARCMDLLGLEGTDADLLVEKCFRDQKVFDIFEGTGQIQRVVITRRLFTNLEKL